MSVYLIFMIKLKLNTILPLWETHWHNRLSSCPCALLPSGGGNTRTTSHCSKDTVACACLQSMVVSWILMAHGSDVKCFFLCCSPKLLLYERNWLNRWKTSTLHEGEGAITNVQWRANLIAWANNVVRTAVKASESDLFFVASYSVSS